jgi:hypothetical protein
MGTFVSRSDRPADFQAELVIRRPSLTRQDPPEGKIKNKRSPAVAIARVASDDTKLRPFFRELVVAEAGLARCCEYPPGSAACT